MENMIASDTGGLSGLRGLLARQLTPLTLILCLAGYGLVTITFAGILPYPAIDPGTVAVLAHVIAVINGLALAAILRGWYLARQGRFTAHRRMMGTAFSLILVFLVIYLFKVGGGGVREFAGPELARVLVYLPMLFTHLALSIVAMPLVLYVLLLGLSRGIGGVPETPHARLGRWAAGSWAVSLILGIGAYFMLNHLYAAQMAVNGT